MQVAKLNNMARSINIQEVDRDLFLCHRLYVVMMSIFDGMRLF